MDKDTFNFQRGFAIRVTRIEIETEPKKIIQRVQKLTILEVTPRSIKFLTENGMDFWWHRKNDIHIEGDLGKQKVRGQ